MAAVIDARTFVEPLDWYIVIAPSLENALEANAICADEGAPDAATCTVACAARTFGQPNHPPAHRAHTLVIAGLRGGTAAADALPPAVGADERHVAADLPDGRLHAVHRLQHGRHLPGAAQPPRSPEVCGPAWLRDRDARSTLSLLGVNRRALGPSSVIRNYNDPHLNVNTAIVSHVDYYTTAASMAAVQLVRSPPALVVSGG